VAPEALNALEESRVRRRFPKPATGTSHAAPLPSALFALLISVLACGCQKMNLARHDGSPRAQLSALDDASLQRLAERKIYFGHQSVGTNIIDGIRDLQRDLPRLHLTIIRNSNPAAVPGGAFVESLVGKNGDPASKTASFLAALDAGMGSHGGIAMYKYCFVDVSAGTDVSKMFAEYKAASDVVRAKYPKVIPVHITIPLTASGRSLKTFARFLLGKPNEQDLQLKRNQFNDLLRAEYGGKEPIFDLAAVESTRLDGTRVSVYRGNYRVYSLASEFTSDGGHLNELGRRLAAEQLLLTLARL